MQAIANGVCGGIREDGWPDTRMGGHRARSETVKVPSRTPSPTLSKI